MRKVISVLFLCLIVQAAWAQSSYNPQNPGDPDAYYNPQGPADPSIGYNPLSPSEPATQVSDGVFLGDVDSDGVVDLADAVLVINHYVGKPVTVFNAKAADVDGDGVIDLADAVLIINYYVGKIPSLSRSIDKEELEAQ